MAAVTQAAATWLHAWGITAPLCVRAGVRAAENGWWVALAPEVARDWMPYFDTRGLATRARSEAGLSPWDALACETLLAMLGAPLGFAFDSLDAWASAVRVRCHIAQAACHTALAFRTSAAERPARFWRYDDDHGFLLQADASLVDALVAATQPEATGRLYDFSCYRATEYVILLGMARELACHHPELLEHLQRASRQHAIRSGQFHEVFLVEHGHHEAPLPSLYYVPGDRVWFRNPDEDSSDVTGYEGSWVIYMGGGLFSNFWRRDAPFTLEGKCVEIFHWRHALSRDERGDPCIDETLVARHVAQTLADPLRVRDVLHRMLRPRDAKGVHAEGGCIDTTREHARCVAKGSTRLGEALSRCVPGAAMPGFRDGPVASSAACTVTHGA